MTTSVVIPTYQSARFVGRALASVFAQTRLPAEVVVVDDASTDDTVAAVGRAAAGAPVPVRVVRLAENSGGPARPLTAGFDAAAGDFIAPLDHDDVFLPHKIERQSGVLERRADLNFAAGVPGFAAGGAGAEFAARFAELARAGTPIAGCDAATAHGGPELLAALLVHDNFVLGFPGFTFRRSAWAAARPVDESLRVGADYDFLCRLCLTGGAALIGEVHYLRHDHADNLSRDRAVMRMDAARVRARYLPLAGPLRDSAAGTRIRQQFYGAAYAARNAGAYGLSWECLRLVGRVWGWDRDLASWAAKLAACQGWAAVRPRRRPLA